MYKRGVRRNQRDGLGWGLVRKVDISFGKAVGLFLPAEPRRRGVPLHGVLDGGVGRGVCTPEKAVETCHLTITTFS